MIGRIFTWGLGKDGELGHGKLDRSGVCPFPSKVASLRAVAVACGQCVSAAISDAGQLYMWGRGAGGRLGQGHEQNAPTPTLVRALAGKFVLQVSVGESHAACIISSVANSPHGSVYTWGKNNHGCLGDGTTTHRFTPGPVDTCSSAAAIPSTSDTLLPSAPSSSATPSMTVRSSSEPVGVQSSSSNCPLTDVCQVVCGYQATLAVTAQGHLYTWGHGAHGKLGHGDEQDRLLPTRVENLPATRQAHMGSLYAAAITSDGALYTWGYGASGNLGHGDRRSLSKPKRVDSLREHKVVHVHCTVGQINPPGSSERKEGKDDKSRSSDVKVQQGIEGPHTMAVTEDGSLWTWGTCHKGILGNMRDKTLTYPGDELKPYRVGSATRDHPEDGPSPYLQGLKVVSARASSIHSAALTSDGRLWTFGCGSDGRMGIKKYMEGLSGARSRMKCYVSQPTAIEALEEGGWHVLQMDTSRRHMIALAVLRDKNS